MEAVEFPVPGARLHTEIRGSGPLLLLIHGGNGDCASYDAVAEPLAAHFTVLAYVRRGFVRSPLDAPPDDDARIAADTADAAALISALGAPAFVFGSSSGAIVALDVVTRHPDLVRTAVVHEPPILELLSDPEAWTITLWHALSTYDTQGLWPALAEFGEAVGLLRPVGSPDGDLASQRKAQLARIQENLTFWFEHEFDSYPRYRPDIAAVPADRIVLAGGIASTSEICRQPCRALGARLGRELVEFPGGHSGYGEHPAEFAAQLVELLLSPGRFSPGR